MSEHCSKSHLKSTTFYSNNSVGDHLAECPCVALGQVLFMKIRNLVHFADFNSW